jgi:hypothetical protein
MKTSGWVIVRAGSARGCGEGDAARAIGGALAGLILGSGREAHDLPLAQLWLSLLPGEKADKAR